MKVVLAAHGTRGDVEPCATVGLELLRRGHEVRMAVPPNLVNFVESAGLAAVGYGSDSQEQVNAVADFVHHALKLQNPISLVRKGRELFVEGWEQMSRTLIHTGGRGGSACNWPDVPRGRRQRRGILRYSVGGTPPLPDLRQWPAGLSVATIAAAPGPLHTKGGPGGCIGA